MKHIFILASLISGILICNVTAAGKSIKTGKRVEAKKQTTLINVTASNSTAVQVNVWIQNQVTGVSYSFFIPPNAPSGTVVAQVPKSDDYYRILMQAPSAVKMRFYWAESSGPTTDFYTENVPLAGCESCPSIFITYY